MPLAVLPMSRTAWRGGRGFKLSGAVGSRGYREERNRVGKRGGQGGVVWRKEGEEAREEESAGAEGCCPFPSPSITLSPVLMYRSVRSAMGSVA